MPDPFANPLVAFLVGALVSLDLLAVFSRQLDLAGQFNMDFHRGLAETFDQCVDQFAQLVQSHVHRWVGDFSEMFFLLGYRIGRWVRAHGGAAQDFAVIGQAFPALAVVA